MAGEPSLYLVYQDFNANERTSGSWHGTQAAADAAALAAGSDFSAHQGAVTVPNGWGTEWIYHPVNGTWRLTDVDDLPELGQRKYAAQALYAALDEREREIAWAGAMLTGPSDAADLDTLIQKSSALTDAEVPTATAAWVSPVDASRSALAGSKVASGRWNAGIGDLTVHNPGNGAWIQDIA